MVDIPEFLRKGMANGYRLLHKKFGGLEEEAKINIETLLSEGHGYQECRKHLLLSYYYYNCYPPEEEDTDKIMEIGHDKFQKDLNNKQKILKR